jgi:hypothetical protein
MLINIRSEIKSAGISHLIDKYLTAVCMKFALYFSALYSKLKKVLF